jgi:16S rRNA A1518/A1519 N6-dimethyltransferase RsmA/KsgA/DIM1 with predicted DNA glycosylase/AP lyase activity
LVSEELKEKLTAEPGFIEYSSLTVLQNIFYKPYYIDVINKKNFFPKGIDKHLFYLEYKGKSKLKREPKVLHLLNNIFRFKNKDLNNALQFLKLEDKSSGLQRNYLTEKVNLLEPKEYEKILEKLL